MREENAPFVPLFVKEGEIKGKEKEFKKYRIIFLNVFFWWLAAPATKLWRAGVLVTLVLFIVSCGSNEYKVKEVIDGDTIELEDGKIVRLIGIDTPETRIKQDDGTWLYQPQACAEKAKEYNRELVGGKKVRLEYDIVQKDKYNRNLAYVFVRNTFVNAELVKQGYALLLTIPPNVRYIDLFVKCQKEARKNKRGLWREVNDEPVLLENACNYEGKVIYVQGRVLDVYEGRDIVILNFGKGEKDFRAVIFKNNLTIFVNKDISYVTDYMRKNVRIYGRVKIYRGAPEIILDVPDQIEIVPDSN